MLLTRLLMVNNNFLYKQAWSIRRKVSDNILCISCIKYKKWISLIKYDSMIGYLFGVLCIRWSEIGRYWYPTQLWCHLTIRVSKINLILNNKDSQIAFGLVCIKKSIPTLHNPTSGIWKISSLNREAVRSISLRCLRVNFFANRLVFVSLQMNYANI